jgi:hypothetical protein
MQQSAKVGGPHVMHDGERAADLFGLSRHHPQMSGNLLFECGSAARRLIGAHDAVQLIPLSGITSVD